MMLQMCQQGQHAGFRTQESQVLCTQVQNVFLDAEVDVLKKSPAEAGGTCIQGATQP